MPVIPRQNDAFVFGQIDIGKIEHCSAFRQADMLGKFIDNDEMPVPRGLPWPMCRLGGAYEALSCAVLVVGDKDFFGSKHVQKHVRIRYRTLN